MSFRKGMKKTSRPAKQQIESRQLDNKGNDIDAVVEQIPFQSICTDYIAVFPFRETSTASLMLLRLFSKNFSYIFLRFMVSNLSAGGGLPVVRRYRQIYNIKIKLK